MKGKNGRIVASYRGPFEQLVLLRKHLVKASLACEAQHREGTDPFEAGYAAGVLTGLLVAFELLSPAGCRCPETDGIRLHERDPKAPGGRCPHADVYGRALGQNGKEETR